MKTSLLQTLLHLVVGVIILAAILWVFAPARGTAVELAPVPTPAAILVHVDGAVQRPGVYELPPGSRLGEAVEAAGGLRLGANSQVVNLAAKLKDGDKVVIPLEGTPAVNLLPGDGEEKGGKGLTGNNQNQEPSGNDSSPAETLRPVNINTATLDELQTLPGIGPTRAEQIVVYREANGGFDSIEELIDVPGIGQVTYNNLKEWITVN